MAGIQAGGTEMNGKEPKRKRSKGVIAGVVAAVIVVAALGFNAWHGTPSFCTNTICHDVMNAYLETYSAAAGVVTADKWGNEVANADAMLSVAHKTAGTGCLDCHEPSLGQQLSEGLETVSGGWNLPLDERDQEDLMENAGRAYPSGIGDEFCMNASCHADLTREKLTELTADYPRNPHAWQHADNACTDCHKSHRASVNICTQCHVDAYAALPDGWIDVQGEEQVLEAQAAA